MSMRRECLTLVFQPKVMRASNVTDVVRRLFVKYGIPQRGFELDFVESDIEISERLNNHPRALNHITGHGFIIEVGSDVTSAQLWRSHIDAETPLRIPWDEWVIDLFNDAFVSAWVADADYQFWQNAEDLLQYRSGGRSWKHLRTKSNGLPPPLERTIVDISHNPGRWALRVGFIEAVGALMWFGDRFWQVSGVSKGDVLAAPGLECTETTQGLLRVRAAEQCFTTDQGDAGNVQRRLRALLFPG